MAQEIERKWLAVVTGQLAPKRSLIIESAYLCVDDPEIRVARYRGVPGSYQITAKKGKGLAREEVAVDVEDGDGLAMFNMAEHYISKVRDDVGHDRHLNIPHPWEIDSYLGRYSGIVVVEIELPYKSCKLPDLPVGVRLLKEVTEDPRWKNKAMACADEVTVDALTREYFDAAAPGTKAPRALPF